MSLFAYALDPILVTSKVSSSKNSGVLANRVASAMLSSLFISKTSWSVCLFVIVTVL